LAISEFLLLDLTSFRAVGGGFCTAPTMLNSKESAQNAFADKAKIGFHLEPIIIGIDKLHP